MSMFTAMPTAGAASITRAVPTAAARLSSTAMTSSVVTPAPIAAVTRRGSTVRSPPAR